MNKQECPICGNYVFILEKQHMCWDCYIKNCKIEPECKGGEE